jgi:hypothetical protein
MMMTSWRLKHVANTFVQETNVGMLVWFVFDSGYYYCVDGPSNTIVMKMLPSVFALVQIQV